MQPRLTCAQKVAYHSGHGRCVQGPRRPDAPEPARRSVRAGRADAQRARGAVADDALRRDEAPEGLGGGAPRDHAAARSREAPLPEPRPDSAHPRPLGEQVRGALGGGAVRAQARPGGGQMEKAFEIYIKTTPEQLWEAITASEMRAK